MSNTLRFTTILAATVIVSFGVLAPTAGFATQLGVNLQVNGYLPGPPGVSMYMESGRPYYMERDRRVYVERDPKYRKNKHRKEMHRNGHDQREHEDRGRGNGHDKHSGRD